MIASEDSMPLYEYQCQHCGVRFERIERASSLKDGHCPECRGIAHRLIGAPALQFKGSGWYINDYGKGNGTGATAKEAAAATTAVDSTSDSQSTKSEKKTDSKVA
jgi:putative FmdB family regulatory protein